MEKRKLEVTKRAGTATGARSSAGEMLVEQSSRMMVTYGHLEEIKNRWKSGEMI